MLTAAWKAYYAKHDLLTTTGLPLQKIRALHLSVFPVLTWRAGTRGGPWPSCGASKPCSNAWPEGHAGRVRGRRKSGRSKPAAQRA